MSDKHSIRKLSLLRRIQRFFGQFLFLLSPLCELAVFSLIFMGFSWGSYKLVNHGIMLFKEDRKATVTYVHQKTQKKQELLPEPEAVLSLREEIWRGLGEKQKIQVLNTIVVKEKEHLGMKNDITLNIEKLGGEKLGCCEISRADIILDKEHVLTGKSWEVLESLCHEIFHAYEYEMIGLCENSKGKYRKKVLESVQFYKSEFEYYISGVDDFDGYYQQQCEKDARKYAEKAVGRYQKQLSEYVKK